MMESTDTCDHCVLNYRGLEAREAQAAGGGAGIVKA